MSMPAFCDIQSAFPTTAGLVRDDPTNAEVDGYNSRRDDTTG